jgi:hypothetical protein
MRTPAKSSPPLPPTPDEAADDRLLVLNAGIFDSLQKRLFDARLTATASQARYAVVQFAAAPAAGRAALAGDAAVPAWKLAGLRSDDFTTRQLRFRSTAPAERAIKLSDLLQGRASSSAPRGMAVCLASGLGTARTVQTPGKTAHQRNTALVSADVTESLLAGEVLHTIDDTGELLLLPRFRAPYPALFASLGALAMLAA